MDGVVTRSAWLDAVRATAIAAVVVYHTVQMSPFSGSALVKITHYGQYGVDLFFVLSGWLIGLLFWNELLAFGNVDVFRFWMRRALRTVPPYFVALALSWCAVSRIRGEPFDFSYLLFLQNYYERIPFFLVSWSLCIEEHFYAAAPALSILALWLVGVRWFVWVLIFFLALPPFARAVEFISLTSGGAGEFGYMVTATHLHLDGIVAGFGASFVAARWPEKLRAIIRMGSRQLMLGMILFMVVLVEIVGGKIHYIWFTSLVSLLFCYLVVTGVFASDDENSLNNKFVYVTRQVAVFSYSAYLMHPLAIHATRHLISKAPVDQWFLYWPMAAFAIAIATCAFYYAFEYPSILIRDMIIPKRAPRVHVQTCL